MAISIDLGKVRFNWKGPWSSGAAYAVNDVVSYSGNSYFCVAAHSAQTPSTTADTAYWNKMAQGSTESLNMFQADRGIRPSSGRHHTYPYDYMSGYTNNNSLRDWTIYRMSYDGKLSKIGSGGDMTSYSSGSGSTSYKNMVQSDYSNNNFTSYALQITVPAYTDVVQIRGNDGTLGFTLIDPSTGKSPCGKNSKDTNERVFRYSGNGSLIPPIGAFGDWRMGHAQGHDSWAEWAVPRLASDKNYYLVRGGHSSYSRHGSESMEGWLSGVAYGQNPWGLLQCPGATAHYAANGESVFGLNYWDNYGMPMMNADPNSTRYLKVPVAPGVTGDIVFWIYMWHDGHGQGLRRLVVNSRSYALGPPLGLSPVCEALQERSSPYRWQLMECLIENADIPSDVRASGGHLTVGLDNTYYDDHTTHFSDYGTYFVNPTEAVYRNNF